MVDVVPAYHIIGHDARLPVPAPADADAGIGDIADCVVLDADAAHKAGADAEAAPVFVGGIVDAVVADGQSGADFTLVGGMIWQVRLVALRAETACEDGCASNIGKRTVVDSSSIDKAVVVEGRRSCMAEGAALETQVGGAVDDDGSTWAAYPALVVELVVAVGTADLRSYLVCLNHIHAGLQRCMSLDTWPQPGRMLEGYSFKCDVLYGLVGCALSH